MEALSSAKETKELIQVLFRHALLELTHEPLVKRVAAHSRRSVRDPRQEINVEVLANRLDA